MENQILNAVTSIFHRRISKFFLDDPENAKYNAKQKENVLDIKFETFKLFGPGNFVELKVQQKMEM